MAGIIVVFDFDRTIIDGDSDNWVVTQMGLTELFRQLFSTLPWNSLMDRMMEELCSQGKTAEDISKCLKQTHLHPRIITAIRSAHALGCDLIVVSDANQFFIERILEHHGLLGCFSHIYTNPTSVGEEGRLSISPYNDLTSPHGCCLCPPNLCKGLVVDQIRASASRNGKKRFIYLGDGKGDFCPTLRLEHDDYVMPRKNYPLCKCLYNNSMLVKAQVREWSDGEELEKILLHLITTISSNNSAEIGNSNQTNLPECNSPIDSRLHPGSVSSNSTCYSLVEQGISSSVL